MVPELFRIFLYIILGFRDVVIIGFFNLFFNCQTQMFEVIKGLLRGRGFELIVVFMFEFNIMYNFRSIPFRIDTMVSDVLTSRNKFVK